MPDCPFSARLALAAAAVGTVVSAQVAVAVPTDAPLVFADEFDSPATIRGYIDDDDELDVEKRDDDHNTPLGLLGMQSDDPSGPGELWSHWELGRHRRDAVNDARAVSMADGHLTIKTWSERDAGGTLRHHTGMISTQNIFERAHGYYEARIDFDSAPGQWSAFWLYQNSISRDPSPTGETGVEMDIVEHRARGWNNEDISGQGSSNMHWNGYDSGHMGDYFHTRDLGLDEGFHTYGLSWSPEGYEFFIDGQLTWTAPNTPTTSAEQYIILSSEVQDDFWAGSIPDGGYGSFEETTTKMTVDYVRVFATGPSVPEPTGAAVLGVVALAGLRRRRTA